jgi:dolichol-phosphate mannosyltransferase
VSLLIMTEHIRMKPCCHAWMQRGDVCDLFPTVASGPCAIALRAQSLCLRNRSARVIALRARSLCARSRKGGAGMSNLSRLSLSVVIAATNDEAIIESVTRQTLDRLALRLETFEIILVDDGSTDRTGRLMDAMAASHARIRVIHCPRALGVGAVHPLALDAARCDYMIMLRARGNVSPASLPALLEKIGSADIVIPYLTNRRDIESPARHLLSRACTGLINWLSGLHMYCYEEPAVHRVALLRSVVQARAGLALHAELLVSLVHAGCSYVEIGVHGGDGGSSRSALRSGDMPSAGRAVLAVVRSIVAGGYGSVPARAGADA